ncbi:MAG: hypothetical protein DRM99_03990 [Thermoplasmata archaeon]|nr:MAG: hypothetical protein DRM99_03990 [Thermoplasmata archaeon]RLF50896.1 MAG: hypothetical protein DRN24_05825 [Thermoplasmata archaeon]
MILAKKNNLISIRRLEEKDINELYELLQGLSEKAKKFFHPHSFDLNTLKNICKSKQDHYFVMTLENKIIGYSFLRLFGYENPSFGCCIRNGFENKGYGTMLTQWTTEKAKELGYKKVILKTYKENISAQKVYKKVGYKIIGETEDGKEYKMEKKL